MTPEEIEEEAIRIHDISEAMQHKISKRRGHHAGYLIMKWEDIKEGFYKERVRKAAKERLEKKVKKK